MNLKYCRHKKQKTNNRKSFSLWTLCFSISPIVKHISKKLFGLSEISSTHSYPPHFGLSETSRWNSSITKEVAEKLKDLYDNKARWYEVFQVNQIEFEVKGDVKKQRVQIEFEVKGDVHLNEIDFVDECYSTKRWTLAYMESIRPLGDKADWDIPPHIAAFICRPPSTRIPSGRRRKRRIPCVWEDGKYRTKSKSYKCGRCGEAGHNKVTCVAAI